MPPRTNKLEKFQRGTPCYTCTECGRHLKEVSFPTAGDMRTSECHVCQNIRRRTAKIGYQRTPCDCPKSIGTMPFSAPESGSTSDGESNGARSDRARSHNDAPGSDGSTQIHVPAARELPGFYIGGKYQRSAIHAALGGRPIGGISPLPRLPVILLFAVLDRAVGTGGAAHRGTGRWTDEDVFELWAEDDPSSTVFTKANLAVREHMTEGQDLLLFESTGVDPDDVLFVGQMFLVGTLPATADHPALFQLVRLPLNSTIPFGTDEEADLDDLELDALRKAAQSAVQNSVAVTERTTQIRRRSAIIRKYALKRANGTCEGCEAEAPFLTRRLVPYLEVHHVRRLSDGGPDDPCFVVAICPTCHRRAHHAQDGEQYNARLTQRAQDIEASFAS